MARGGAVLAAALVVVSVLGYLAPLRLVSYRLVVEAAVPSVPGTRGPLFGWAELVATAPGARPLTLVEPLKPGQRRVVFDVDATGLVRASRRAVGSARGVLAEALRGEASSLAVVMFLYDSRGNHYIASAVLGSYEVALARLHDPLKAAKLVSRDPYLVLHAGHIVFRAQGFSVVNVTGLYRSIVEKYYGSSQPRAPGARVAPAAGLRLPGGCTPVTIDNYRSYSLRLTSSDFIVLPDLYNAQPPPSFYQHLQGVPRAYKTAAYRFMARHYSTAVYVPANTCSLPRALQAALQAWYDPASQEETPMAGLLTLQDFWKRIAGPSAQWVDATKGHVEKITRAPLLRITGVCQADCTSHIAFIASISVGRFEYHEEGISVAGLIVLPHEPRSKLKLNQAVRMITPYSFMEGDVGFITADVVLRSDGDGVFIDYYVDKTTVYDSQGNPHAFWRIEPLIVFLPLQDVAIDWSTLQRSPLIKIGSQAYSSYMAKYYKLMGATRPGFKWKSYSITRDTLLDTTNPVNVETSIAGAVIGLEQSMLGLALTTLIQPEGAVAEMASIAGSLFSYALTTLGADAVVVKLDAQYDTVNTFNANFKLLKVTPYGGYYNLYFTGLEKGAASVPGPLQEPLLMTYFIVYKGEG